MNKQWILGTLGIAVLAVTLLIIGGRGTQADVHAAARGEPARALTATLVVTSADDSGDGTLRWALLTVVASDTITFDPTVFPPGSPATITLASALPGITQGNLTIDASNAGVILQGNGLTSGHGLAITSDDNTIQGLQILNFYDNGINLSDGASNNIIGGSDPGQGNFVLGNRDGIVIAGASTQNNVVIGNHVGLNDNTGSPWCGSGVCLRDGAAYNRIGGLAAGEGNLLEDTSILIRDGSDYNQILNNTILAEYTGVRVDFGGDYNEIISNTIRGAKCHGIRVGWASAPAGTQIISNTITENGWSPACDSPHAGISLDTPVSTTIAHNEIYNNWVPGIAVQGGDALINTITQNSIYNNTGLGIDLRDYANAAIRPPVVVYTNTVTGIVTGTACVGCWVEVFSDDGDEGRWYEGTVTATITGAWSFDKGDTFTGPNVHATATDAAGNTSEFSGPPPVVSSVSPTGTVTDTLNLVVTINGDRFREDEPLMADLGPGVTLTHTQFISSTQFQATLDVDAGASLGPRDVTVTNFDGQSGVGLGLFEIVSISPFDPPTLNAVLPTQVAAIDQTIRLIVSGDDFVMQPAVSTDPGGPEIVVENVTYVDDTRLQVDVHTWPTTTLGSVDLTLTNPDRQGAILSDAFEIVAPLFTDVAPSLGLDANSGWYGAAWGDLDGDGWLDLAIGNSALFTNTLGSSFSDATAAAGLEPITAMTGAGIAWGDYDNDGNLDLLSSWRKVYRQNGLPFTKVWDAAGIRGSLAWVDYDLDGDLDVYASYRLYRNDGGDVFNDVTDSVGLSDVDRPQASVWADYDDDGDPDLFLTHGGGNRLYRNDGDGAFTDVSSAVGIGATGSYGGAAWGDYDNDGDFDLFVVSSYDQHSILYRNEGDGTFQDVSATAGLYDQSGWATGANWLDYNLDGWLDIFVVKRREQNQLYRNNGDGTFTDVAPGAGVADRGDSAGSSVGDYDNDGDPDIYVTSGNLLFQNGANPGAGGPHWLKVRLEGTLSNHSAIGAVVRIYGDGPVQMRQLAGSTGYMSQDALEALLGLGGYTGAVAVEVAWPSGVVDTLADVAVDQLITVIESTPHLRDVAVVNVTPGGEAPVDQAFTIYASLRNLGNQVESGIPVTCEIEHVGANVYVEARTSDTIQPAAWALLDFPAYTPTALGVHTLTCRSALPDDEQSANDVYSRTLTVIPQTPPDAWTKDNPNDNGDVPSGHYNWYMSPDIWVRHLADGGLVHEEPIEGAINTVYVRLRNRGALPITGTVDVTWIEPSLGVRCGDWAPIDTIAFANLLPGEVRIVSTLWAPTRSGHTCLQTVIDASSDPYDHGLECAPQWVPWDNNISWRNVNIYANPETMLRGAMDVRQAKVQLVNVYDRPQDVDVIVERMTFPTTGTIVVLLPEDLFDRWLAYGAGWGDGIEVLTESKEIHVNGTISATIGAVPMLADEEATVGLRFEGPAGLEFEMALRERIDGITTGGVGYQWVIPDTTPPEVADVFPADGATGVALDASIVITFTEQIGPLSLDLTLTPDPGGWHTTWNDAGGVVTATHASFVKGTTYTATVAANDVAGNALVEQPSWSFTTLRYKVYLPLIVKH